jgi:hypothetical protein
MNEAVESFLTEFRALKEEVDHRGYWQQGILALNFSALGSILGISLSSPEWWNSSILLVIPLLCSFLSLLYLNHDFQISTIGLYIRDRISPQLCALTGNSDIMGWESWLRTTAFTNRSGRWLKLLREITYFLAAPALLVLPSIAALSVAFIGDSQTEGWTQWILWIIGLVLTVLNTLLWCLRYRLWLGHERDT